MGGAKVFGVNTLGRQQLGIFYGGSDSCVVLSNCLHSPTPGTVGDHMFPQFSLFLSINEGSDHPGSGSG